MEPENAHLEKDKLFEPNKPSFLLGGFYLKFEGCNGWNPKSWRWMVQMIFPTFKQGMFEFYVNFLGVYF